MIEEDLQKLTEDSKAAIAGYRAALVDISLDADVLALMRKLNDIAFKEGEHRVFERAALVYKALIANGAGSREAALKVYLQAVRWRATDDTWSGRSNDVRRSEYDGGIAAIDRLADALDIHAGNVV